MIRTIQALLILLLLGFPTAAMAQVPDGQFVFELSGDNEIYDIGNFSDCETESSLGLSVTLCLDINMVADGKGKYSGTANLEFSGDIVGLLQGPATGSIKGSDTKDGKGTLKFSTTGFLVFLGQSLSTTIATSCKGPVDSTGFFASLCKIKVKIAGAGSATIPAFFDAQADGGTWTCTFNLVPLDEKTFEGTAFDTLGNSYVVKGKYNAKKGTSQVKASGTKGTSSFGAKIQLKNLTPSNTAELKYKVQGYKGTSVVEAD